ncbi:hypothetical protein [Epilithonimonas sp.]|uniref:hypothetical protein n=1 Tax=Epilithonimonas sp. TaxID=2894511 RepID=UPI00289CE6AA|nr:hypothetical protein [Epilithonimonas sp.]
MSEKLDQLKTAFKDYLMEVFATSRQDVDAYLNRSRHDVERIVNDFVDHGTSTTSGHQITDRRALKLKNNLELSDLSEFSYKYKLEKDCINFIAANATDGIDLIFDLIALPNRRTGDKKIDFAMSFSDDPGKYYLVFDGDHVQDISNDFATYKDNFDSIYKDSFDEGFQGNIFSGNENTKKIVVSYDSYFKSLCEMALEDDGTKALLFFNTGLISFDLEDIFRGESRLNFFNMGQFTLYYELEHIGNGIAAMAATQYGDVFPTYPPLRES